MSLHPRTLPPVAGLLLFVVASCSAPDTVPTPTSADSAAAAAVNPQTAPTAIPAGGSLASATAVLPAASDAGLCLTYSWGDARHLDSCRPSTRAECLIQAEGEDAVALDDSAAIDLDYTDYGEELEIEFIASATETCSVMYAASAREAEDMMSGQWGWWVHSSAIEVGDPAFTYGPSVEVREGPDQGSPVTHVVEANATPLVILEKSERTQVNDMGGSWFRVQVGTVEGWIWGEFVHPDPLSEREYIG